MEPREGLETVAKRDGAYLSGNQTPAVRPVASELPK
jgi:hypothetical protein